MKALSLEARMELEKVRWMDIVLAVLLVSELVLLLD